MTMGWTDITTNEKKVKFLCDWREVSVEVRYSYNFNHIQYFLQIYKKTGKLFSPRRLLPVSFKI